MGMEILVSGFCLGVIIAGWKRQTRFLEILKIFVRNWSRLTL